MQHGVCAWGQPSGRGPGWCPSADGVLGVYCAVLDSISAVAHGQCKKTIFSFSLGLKCEL